mgnify:CR=1 FL=1
MLELYIKNKETLELFISGLKEAGLGVVQRRFLGFRVRPETAVIEITERNVGAVVRAVAVATAKNPEGQTTVREHFKNNTADWLVQTAGKVEGKKPGSKK